MSKGKTGGPAFPQPFYDEKGHVIDGFGGMTLRDYFAAKAMQTLLLAKPRDWPMGFDVSVSVAAYQMADAMLEARES